MRFSRVALPVVTILATLTFASGAVAATTARLGTFGIRSASPPLRKLYVADSAHNAIDLFPVGVARPKQIGAITKGIAEPVDVFVDAAGALYVANATGTVVEFAAGAHTPERTISLGTEHPLYLSVGPDGAIYVMAYNKNGSRWEVLQYDVGATKPSRIVHVPYENPYPLVGGGIAIGKDNYLYVNEGAFNSGGGFGIEVFKPHATKPFKAFGVSYGYAGGAVQIIDDRIFVGDPQDNAVDIARLPIRAPFKVLAFPTESAGDYLTFDPASSYLYAVSYGTKTLQIYDLRSGRLLNFLQGFDRGVAVDPVTP